MGSGDWFKTIINLKKVKDKNSKQSKAKSKKNGPKIGPASSANGIKGVRDEPVEDWAATRIQTVFRAYMARKTLRRLKGMARLQILIQKYPVKKQSASSLNYLHSWSKMQSEIGARRLCMVTEGRLKQKKLENQLKLEAKLHDFEVEWSGGSETMEESLARIHQRGEAAVKRERAMAYAFSHQWRANSSPNRVNYELGKANWGWGWSWKERWIAARPWESRIPSPKKCQNKQANKIGKNTPSPKTLKTPVASKPSPSNGKVTTKPRRLSYPAAEIKSTPEKPAEPNLKKEQLVS